MSGRMRLVSRIRHTLQFPLLLETQMLRITFSCTVCAIVAVAFSAMLVSSHSNELPGDPVLVTELDAVIGRACGEFASTQGNGPCTFPIGPCATVPTTRGGSGVDCSTPGAPCEDCATPGGTHITCQGGYDMYATHLCSLTTPACCPLNTCVNGANPLLWTCDCTAPTTPPMGMRMVATMTYNLPPGC
jgi:hypothetical protein